jgi:hypothetical protein
MPEVPDFCSEPAGRTLISVVLEKVSLSDFAMTFSFPKTVLYIYDIVLKTHLKLGF